MLEMKLYDWYVENTPDVQPTVTPVYAWYVMENDTYKVFSDWAEACDYSSVIDNVYRVLLNSDEVEEEKASITTQSSAVYFEAWLADLRACCPLIVYTGTFNLSYEIITDVIDSTSMYVELPRSVAYDAIATALIGIERVYMQVKDRCKQR